MKLTRILKEGMTGNDIKHLQIKLKELNFFDYPIATGNFGGITTKSVISFQIANNIPPTGIVDNVTWYKLTNEESKPTKGSIIDVNTSVLNKPIVNKTPFPYKPSIVTAEGLEIYDVLLSDDEYIKTKVAKKTIYIHHTAGGCFVGETKVSLLDGSSIRIDEMLKDEEYWIYGCTNDGTIVPTKAIGLGETKRVNKLIEITLDNGKKETCTLEHKWMMRDGEYKEAHELNINDSLMPLYKRLDKCGYEEVKNNNDLKWYKTHQLSGKHKYGDDIYKRKEQMVLHHVDFNKLNNSSDNLLLMEKDEHILYHSTLMKENWQNEDWKKEYNHKIIDIKIIELGHEVPVYDIYSPDTSNFALSSGVFVHNSRPDWVINGWGKDGNGKSTRIATSYVVGRKASSNGDETFDGKVFRAFDDSYWAYHLGAKGTNGVYDKNSIGIEICNYGYCKLIDGKFINYVSREVPAEDVVDLGENFRGHRYWEKYTDAQIESVRKLLIYLIDKHNITIEHDIYDLNWFNYDITKLKGNGIRTHVQVRSDKVDCFPQKELIDMLNTL